LIRLALLRSAFAVSFLGLPGLLPARLTAQRDPGPMWTQDDEWAAIAHRVRGFAGFWQEGSTLVHALVDPTQQAAALRNIAGQVSLDRYTTVRVQPVTYDFAQLLTWKQLVFEHQGDRASRTASRASMLTRRTTRFLCG
jgi:hypothetical protein